MRHAALAALAAAAALAFAAAPASAMPTAASLHHQATPEPATAPNPQPPSTGSDPVAVPAPEDPGPALPEDPAATPRSLQVQAGEYYLRLSHPSVLAGDVRVEFDNTRGEDPHDLRLVRADGAGDVLGFDQLASGALAAKSLRLSAGTWHLFCALPGHEALGMSARLSVTT